MRPRAPRAPRLLALALALGCVPLAAGCGVRTTSVPVDAGAAPSQVGCVLPEEGLAPGDSEAKGNGTARVYLVCGSRVASVERRVDTAGGRGRGPGRRLAVARELLGALRNGPDPEERSAGFETSVPGTLRVTGPRPGDPAGTLRLSRPLAELPAFALAQIVCSYADADAIGSTGESVVLGGPADTAAAPRRFECGSALRTRPGAAATAGTRPTGGTAAP